MAQIDSSPIEPRWVLVDGELRNVSEFSHLKPRQRPQATCPLCQLPVVLKLGLVKAHHYAHLQEAGCVASQPETALHLNTKFHFYRQLQEAQERQLYIEQICLRCHQETQRHIWVHGWEEVKVEYRLDTTRPDLALLAQNQVIGVLEILVTHAVDERKAASFAEQNIPWLEIPAKPELYLEPTAWTTADSLPISSSIPDYPAWTCPQCTLQRERESLREQSLSEITIHAAMMADIYYAQGKKYREVFYVKKRVKEGQWIRAWVEDEKGRTLYAVNATKGQALSNAALHQIKAFITRRLDSFRRQGHIVDEVAPWRLWLKGRKFWARDVDRYPFRFSWERGSRQWVKMF